MKTSDFVFSPPTLKMFMKYGKFYRELSPIWDKLISEQNIASIYCPYSLGHSPEEVVFLETCRKYSEKDRYYHNIEHVVACLREFKEVEALAEHPSEIKAGLFSHDSIYDTHAANNEIKSAQYMRKGLQRIGFQNDFIERAGRIVLVTDHKTQVENIDEALTVDIDLSIFGKPTEIFNDYDKKIRQEYSWVPWDQYCAKRAQVLRSFLDRPQIYHTDYFRQKYEDKARMNLGRTIHDLERNVQKGL
ncbi:N-methyl-D-aspartate receptor NMDAR2C subunit [Candidatus Pacearchaeota archaeon]|nr:N-methyl-D-aspartate receptor NMDAR2C subunit [Candidatus Pacearchaeota archaeon]